MLPDLPHAGENDATGARRADEFVQAAVIRHHSTNELARYPSTSPLGTTSTGRRTAGPASPLEDLAGLIDDQRGEGVQGLVLVQPVGRHQAGQEAGVEAAGHVVPGRDRAERPGVV